MIEPLMLNLRTRDHVTMHEEDVLKRLIEQRREFSAGEDLVQQGSRPSFSTVLLKGIAARYKVLENGSRQITALHVAGDFVDLHAFELKTMDHGVVGMTPCQVGLADHGGLRKISETEPHLTRILWLSTVIDGAIHREWIVAMGRKSRKSHLAHIVCELFLRLKVVDQTRGMSFALPLTQLELADVLGISLVHLNKTLQTLRRDAVLTWVNRTVTIENWDDLARIAQFDPTYLNLVCEAR